MLHGSYTSKEGVAVVAVNALELDLLAVKINDTLYYLNTLKSDLFAEIFRACSKFKSIKRGIFI